MATFSISAVARKAQATANGSTTEFSFSFSVNTEADVAVFVGTTLKPISPHYTVSITSSTGAGSITFTSGNTPTNGQIVTIMSKTALARSSVYTSGGTINATSLETDFDTNMMLFQQQDERLDRAMTAPVDDVPSINMTLPSKSVRASHLLGFDSNGEPSVTGLVTSTNIANDAIGTNHIADSSVTTAKIDDAQITVAKMAANSVDSAQYVDGSIDTAHIADANVTQAKIAGEAINESKLQVSNAPQNGYVLTAQSGNTGGLTWAADTNTTYSVGDGGLTQNNFTNTLKSKLDGIATSANNYVHPNHSGEVTSTADGATVVASNVIDADNLKVTGNGSTSQFLRSDGDGTFTWATPTDTNTEYSVGDGGLTQNNFTNTLKSKLDGIEASATADQTDAEIRAAVEAASDSNVFTDADHTKLNGVAASANNYVHPNHSGEVTSTADGATVIADNVVDEANRKVSNSPVNGYMLTAQSGNTGGLTWAAAGGGGGAMEFIASTGAINNAATVVFTSSHFDSSKYRNYVFIASNVIPVSDSQSVHMVVSTDNGSSYLTSDIYQNSNSSAIAYAKIINFGVGSDTNESGWSGEMRMYNPHDTGVYTQVKSDTFGEWFNGGMYSSYSSAVNTAIQIKQTASINNIKLTFASGNFESGYIDMYGFKNS